MLGTENLTNAVMLGVKFRKQYHESFADGFQVIDLFSFVDEASEMPNIIKSAPLMKAELNDLDLTERGKIIETVKAELDDDEDVEEVVGNAIDWVAATYKLVSKRPKK